MGNTNADTEICVVETVKRERRDKVDTFRGDEKSYSRLS